MGGFEGPVPAAVGLRVVGGLPLLRPAEQVFAAMLEGWRNQQLARNLAFTTAEGRERTTSRLVTEAGGTWSRYAGGDHNR